MEQIAPLPALAAEDQDTNVLELPAAALQAGRDSASPSDEQSPHIRGSY